MANFEGKDRRESTLKKVLPEYGFKNLDEARELCLSKGIDVRIIDNTMRRRNQSHLKGVLWSEKRRKHILKIQLMCSVASKEIKAHCLLCV